MWPTDEQAANANGGTELMKRGLWDRLPPEQREAVNIICSRVRFTDPDKPNILWMHDFVEKENAHLAHEESRERFAALVFVSFWQQQHFHDHLGIPFHEGMVIRNCIEPLHVMLQDKTMKDGDPLRFIYHTTPHRGLSLLVPAFDYVVRNTGIKMHLDVFSSFEAYGWKDRDEEHKELFETIKRHPNMTYHGYKPNDVVREYLINAHVFAYPCIWPETSCIAMIEAMSAGCVVLAPRYGALCETGHEVPIWYPWVQDPATHMRVFAQRLALLAMQLTDQKMFAHRMNIALCNKDFIDAAHSWGRSLSQWQSLIGSVTAASGR